MKTLSRTLPTLGSRLLSVAAAAALVSIPAFAQEPGAQEEDAPKPVRGIGPEVSPEVGPRIGPISGSEQDDAEKRMIELFGKVERRLNEIDRMLSDASAGDTSKLSGVEASGIDKLLDLSKQQGQQAVEDIDEILELAEQMNQQCKSPGSSSECEKPGSVGNNGKTSPIDQVGQQTTQREQTPTAPPKTAESEGGEKPQDGEKQDSKPSGGEPESPLASDDPNPQNETGQNPPGSETEVVRRVDDLDRWGDLPVHARDIFRSEGGGDMPARYRDWIDSYYRRLNKPR